MTNQKNTGNDVRELLKGAEIAVTETVENRLGRLHQLDPSQWSGRRALVLDRKQGGITAAVRVELPGSSPLRGQALASPEALALLGALTLALQDRGMDAKLIAGGDGLEAVMLNSHACHCDVDADSLRDKHLKEVDEVARLVEPALAQKGTALATAILARVRPLVGALVKEELKAQPIVVPTFDEQERDRMMKQASH
ncbi:hypothetical protein ASG87_00050 [Frateuria sp. Soil773]|uniref:hypothetical protein n=1 Tax=Frateuria sp. Soil773 TaxID=1736407 RepID=UPI0006F6A766|nr:hypothetical protein [Frateuria sp. Soil773]KRF02358.1 hypothetical protein ASG87_00050 [Frateuria sp. Soil773]